MPRIQYRLLGWEYDIDIIFRAIFSGLSRPGLFQFLIITQQRRAKRCFQIHKAAHNRVDIFCCARFNKGDFQFAVFHLGIGNFFGCFSSVFIQAEYFIGLIFESKEIRKSCFNPVAHQKLIFTWIEVEIYTERCRKSRRKVVIFKRFNFRSFNRKLCV